jgi:hypothetical protein
MKLYLKGEDIMENKKRYNALCIVIGHAKKVKYSNTNELEERLNYDSDFRDRFRDYVDQFMTYNLDEMELLELLYDLFEKEKVVIDNSRYYELERLMNGVKNETRMRREEYFNRIAEDAYFRDRINDVTKRFIQYTIDESELVSELFEIFEN